MAETIGTDKMELDCSYIIGEYEKKLAEMTDEADKKRVKELLAACKKMDGTPFSELLTLIDTGAFNTVISSYCMRAMRDVGYTDESMQEVLDTLEELYNLDAEDVVLPELSIEESET